MTSGTNRTNIIDIGKKEPQKLINYVRYRLANFKPHSVKRVEIDKDDGRKRPLGIPSIEDRLIQQCIRQVLDPICEAKFHKHSYGFRPNRSTHHAMARALFLTNITKYHYVVDVDIKGFFDNVNHGKLLKQMYTLGIQDKRLLCIISKMLKAEIQGIGIPTKGVPQGGILSPLLSNIVLNELDWWISSQWENMKTRNQYKHTGNARRVLKTTGLKQCYIVRYADDFRIYCHCLDDAHRLMYATKKWLKERLYLEVNENKSKVVNLKKNYSNFLGFKMKLHRKSNKWIIKSFICDKAKVKIKAKIKNAVKDIQHGKVLTDKVNKFNSVVLGIHNYYKSATCVYIDFESIAYSIYKSQILRLRRVAKRKGLKSTAFKKYYGHYTGRIFFVADIAMFPVLGVKNSPPMCFSQEICDYTEIGRAKIHNTIKCVDNSIVHYLMNNPIKGQSTEYNDNRISLYIAQYGKCAITHEPLEIGDMHAHHKKACSLGGDDKYQNLIFLKADLHRLVHATDPVTIDKYLKMLNLNEHSFNKLNKLRVLVGNSNLQYI